jgi:hypothetical protein
LIFQSWEDFLTDLESWKEVQLNVEWKQEDEVSWLAIFLGWAQSNELQQVFPLVELQYNQTTIDFCNMLFDYANNNQIKNMDDLQTLTVKFFNDPAYIKIKTELTL